VICEYFYCKETLIQLLKGLQNSSYIVFEKIFLDEIKQLSNIFRINGNYFTKQGTANECELKTHFDHKEI